MSRNNNIWRRHWIYSGVFIVNFENISHLILVFILLTFQQVNICWRSVLSYSIYTVAERSHRSTVVIVNFERILLSSTVSAVDCEHVFIFWFWSFYISIVFRLRSNQVPFTYRKNFHEVKYFREVSCTVPRKMSGEKSSGNCAGGISWAGNCPGGNNSEVTVQGVFFLGKFHRGQFFGG